MIVRHLSIQNFRGIRNLTWTLPKRVVCLIGPGDSTKTTILDAIEYSLYPYYALTIDDCDFYGATTENTIQIDTTVTNLPEEILADQKFGLMVRGWNPQTGVNDEPQDGDEIGITVRLEVGDPLEPIWSVVNDRSPAKHISHLDRARLCAHRLGSYIDRHLTWGRGSTLNRITEGMGAAASALATAARAMRATIDFSQINEFQTATRTATLAGAKFGVAAKEAFVPHLDSKGLATGISAIAIHDGAIPLRSAGFGTRRLMALGLQTSCSTDGSIVLVDEVEVGLEPYRLRHVLRTLRGQVEGDDASLGQAIMTSHSAISTVEIPAESLAVVRSHDGQTNCATVPELLQGTVRAVPEALLAPRVLVCEGKTEYGLCLGLEAKWRERNQQSFAYQGIALVEGNGAQAPSRADALIDLGYQVCAFLDSDALTQLNPSVEAMAAKGIFVVHWGGEVSTEQRIAADIPVNSLQELLNIASAHFGESSVRDSLRARLPAIPNGGAFSLHEWLNQGVEEISLRNAIGVTAKENTWFKRIDRGEELSRVVCGCLDEIPTSNLNTVISQLRNWVLGTDDNT